jgi:hypothetical protein
VKQLHPYSDKDIGIFAFQHRKNIGDTFPASKKCLNISEMVPRQMALLRHPQLVLGQGRTCLFFRLNNNSIKRLVQKACLFVSTFEQVDTLVRGSSSEVYSTWNPEPSVGSLGCIEEELKRVT